MFSLGERSRRRLTGVHERLTAVVFRAIELTTQDFTVLEGLRTAARQRELVNSGASRTMQSRHLTGHAVDLGAWENGTVSWHFGHYYPIAWAMARAARELGAPIRWGGCWEQIQHASSELDIRAMVVAYADRQRARGRSIFTDGPHFELPRQVFP